MRKIITFLLLLVSNLYMTISAQTTPPSTATLEDWTISYTFVYDGTSTPDSETMQVAFDGSDVYFNFPNPIKGNTWMKGSIADGKATFPKGQLVGTYSGSDIYYVGQNEGGLCDIVFNYDTQKETFTLAEMWLVLNASLTESQALAYFSSAVVTKEAPTPTPGGESTPPSTATFEDWTISYTYVYDGNSYDESETMQVAFDGANVYFNFPNPVNGNKWMKGIISNGKATFPKGQAIGNYGEYTIYYMGLDTNGLCDIVFNYDAQKKTFTLADMWLVYNAGTTTVQAFAYLSAATVSKEAPKPLEVVTPPDGLQTTEYAFDATMITYAVTTGEWVQEKVHYNVNIGFNGIEVYVQGLCRELPTAWIKGTYDAKEGEMTFASGQYYGKYHFDMFFAGARYPTTNPYWLDEVIFTGADGVYNTSALLMLNGSATEVNPYEFYAGAKLTKIADVAAKPANPTVTYFQPVAAQKDGNYGVICLDIPIVSTEGTNLLTSKLGYQFFLEKDGVPTPYTFSKDTYTKLTEDMTVIPYTFADGYDFYLGGTAIFLYADFENATKIGIQTIYTGGNAENKSDIVWYEPSVDGIHETKNGTVHVISETYSDLQGRPVSSSSKGLLLKTVRTSDGTIKTTKVLKK